MNDDRIVFKRDITHTMNLKKQDRIIIDGPCEIELSDIRISGSLDYEIRFVLSSPRETKALKLGPGSKSKGEQLGEKEKRHLN